jgi:hypothetical protein
LFSSLDFLSLVDEATGSSFLITSVLIVSSVVIGMAVDVVGNSSIGIASAISSMNRKTKMRLFRN